MSARRDSGSRRFLAGELIETGRLTAAENAAGATEENLESIGLSSSSRAPFRD
jgi:hypothetical protein